MEKLKFNKYTSNQDLDQETMIDGLAQNPLIYGLDFTNSKWTNTVGYRYSSNKFQASISGNYEKNKQLITLDDQQVLTKKYTDLLPVITVNYEYKKGMEMHLSFKKSVKLPSLNQLSPVVNDFNPRFITTGNSSLTAQYEDSYSLFFHNYSHKKRSNNFFSYLTYTHTDNAIITSKVIDADYVKHVTYINYGDKSQLRVFIFEEKNEKLAC